MSNMNELPNIGKVLGGLLAQAGIETPRQLRALGAKKAFLRIRETDPSACIRMLYGLQGAVEGVKDSQLSENTKEELKEFFRHLEGVYTR